MQLIPVLTIAGVLGATVGAAGSQEPPPPPVQSSPQQQTTGAPPAQTQTIR